jgi:hypothetical protein
MPRLPDKDSQNFLQEAPKIAARMPDRERQICELFLNFILHNRLNLAGEVPQQLRTYRWKDVATPVQSFVRH